VNIPNNAYLHILTLFLKPLKDSPVGHMTISISKLIIQEGIFIIKLMDLIRAWKVVLFSVS